MSYFVEQDFEGKLKFSEEILAELLDEFCRKP